MLSGLRNIAALRSVITSQKLAYDFKYHVADFNTDINVIVLSEGKSLLQVLNAFYAPITIDSTTLSNDNCECTQII